MHQYNNMQMEIYIIFPLSFWCYFKEPTAESELANAEKQCKEKSLWVYVLLYMLQ